MSKEEQLLQQAYEKWHVLPNQTVYIASMEAMHTYAEQMAVEFAEWLNGNCEPTALGYYHQDHLYSTSDLYKLFTQQNQK